MSTSPHLPPKSCSVPAYYVRQSLPWIFVVVTIAMLSGVAAGLATAAWVLPSLQTSDTAGAVRGGGKQVQFIAPDVVLKKTISQRVLTLYDKTKRRAGVAYAPEAVVGHAAVLSSDGWAVASLPAYRVGAEQQWELIDFQGIAYEPNDVIVDPVTGLVYINIAAEGLPIVSFRQHDQLQVGEVLWAHSPGRWEQTQVSGMVRTAAVPWQIWEPSLRHSLTENVVSGSLLVTSQGHLSGFVDKEQTIVDIEMVQRQLSHLLQEQKLVYRIVPWYGYMVDGAFVEDVYQRRPGFLVTQDRQGTLEVGDIIIAVDGESVRKQSVSRLVLDAADVFSVVVLRDGEEVIVDAEKVALGEG